MRFQSTRPSRGATAPQLGQIRQLTYFNPRAPRGARPYFTQKFTGNKAFQSTRPSRGATTCLNIVIGQTIYFNPRAPRGARRTSRTRRCSSRNFNPRAPRGARQQMCTKITYIFALTHKRNTFSCQTPSVRALSKKLSGRFSHKIRCEPPCKTMCAAAPHYTISVPSGRYVCLQPKCSILLSYFFPK